MLELLNPPLSKALLLSGRMVFGVLFQITVLTRFGDRLRDPRAIYLLEALKLLSKGLLALHCHGNAVHTAMLSCKS